METKEKVFLVMYSSDEEEGVESVHKTLAGAEARIRKVKEEALDSCEYYIHEMALLP